MTTPNTIELVTSTGVKAYVRTVAMPDGSVAPAHAFVDSGGGLISPAQDSTVQALTATIRGLTIPAPPGG